MPEPDRQGITRLLDGLVAMGALLLVSCGTRAPETKLSEFIATTDTDLSSFSRTDCRALGIVVGRARSGSRRHAHAGDDVRAEAVANLRAAASARGANYVLLEGATWGRTTIVQGTAYACRMSPLPPIVCHDDGPRLRTCVRE